MKVSSKTAAALIASAREPWTAGNPRYVRLDPAGAARVLREALKAEFPGVRFWVRAKSYSGGGSVDVYFDGGAGVGTIYAPKAKAPVGAPTLAAVRDFVNTLGGQHFDGMIDMAYDSRAYLLPTGVIRYGGTNGTEGSRGSVPKDPVAVPAGAVELSTYAYLMVSNGVPYDAPADVKAAAEANRDLRAYGAVESF